MGKTKQLSVPAQKAGKQVSANVVIASLQKEAKPILAKLKKLDKIKTKEQYEIAGTNLKLLKVYGKQTFFLIYLGVYSMYHCSLI